MGEPRGNTNVAKPAKVAIIGASGTYGKGILARAEEIGVESVVVTRSIARDAKPLGRGHLIRHVRVRTGSMMMGTTKGAERTRARQCS
jgi:uncharacterized protein YbjT (DUF2867 family)